MAIANIGAIIGGVATVGSALLGRNAANNANAQSAENQREAGRVDYTTMSPEAKKLLQSMFGSAGDLAGQALGTDYTALRKNIIDKSVEAGVQLSLNTEVPQLKAAMGKAGAYNSTSYGLAAADIVASAKAKSFYAGQAAANDAVTNQLSLINPLLALLNVDKGAQKVGKEATGIAGVVQPKTDYDKLAGSLTNGVGGILRLIQGDKPKTGYDPAKYTPWEGS